MLAVVRAAFEARPPLDPPADALGETEESIAAALAHGGLLASARRARRRRAGARPDGCDAVAAPVRGPARGPRARRRRRPGRRGARGRRRRTTRWRCWPARSCPATVAFWERARLRRDRPALAVRRAAPAAAHPRRPTRPTPTRCAASGRRWPASLRAGDLVVLTGELGAGKTTFTQGLGAGLGVRGDVTSPTFVIARVHPSLVGGPGAGARRRLPPRRARRARRPRPRHLARRRGHRRRVGRGAGRGARRRPARGADRAGRGRRGRPTATSTRAGS